MAKLPPVDAAIRRLTVEPGHAQTEFRDERTPGLSLVVGKKARTWFLTYKAPDGQRKRISLGRYPAVGLASARDRSNDVFRTLHDDIDPARARRTYQQSLTVAEAGLEYLRLHASKKTTRRTDETVMRKEVIPEIGGLKLVDVGRREVQAIIRRVLGRGSGVMANRTLEIVRKFLGWCVENGYLETNPAIGISKPTIERPRSRALSDAEISQLWAALDHVSPQARACFKILLLTGQRLQEVLGMRWSEVDLERALWTLPAHDPGRSKARSAPHIVPLAPPVADLLATLREAGQARPTVFLGHRRAGDREEPTRGMVAMAKVTLDSGYFTPAEPWRIHDLRRTVRTGLSQLSVPPHIAELVIGHAAGGLVKVYDRYDYLLEKREALTRWAAHLLTIVGERPGADNVVSLGSAMAR